MTRDELIKQCRLAGLDPESVGRKRLQAMFNFTQRESRRYAEMLKEGASCGKRPQYSSPAKDVLQESHTHSADEWTISLPNTQIQTLEELIAHCKIDLNVWHVEHWECNKYGTVMAEPATTIMLPNKRGIDVPMWQRDNKEPIIVPMFQIKAWLVRKSAHKLKGPDSKPEFLRQFNAILKADDKFKFTTKQMRAPRPDDTDHTETAVVLCSDIHLTETVRPDDANGVNFYNSIVAANRLWEHSQKVKSILVRHMSLYNIEKIWSPLLGDIVNGTIHEEYVATNDLSDPAAVILGSRLLHMFYSELKGLGLPIEIDAVHGNHARLTPKVPTKRQAHTNLDWQCYEMLADKFVNDDQVDVRITTAQIGTKKVYGWNYVFEHGIDVRNGKEEDFEDRVRALFDDPTFREATGYMGSSFDQIIIGNMHKPKFLERTVVNGSYIGQNELGQSWRLKPIRSQQLMWGVSEKFPRTWQYNVDLTHVRDDKPDNPFSEYAAWFLQKHGQ